MQFKIPQDVQREDKIVGPLTLRQLIICGVGFSIGYAVFTILGRDYHWITPAIFTAPIAVVTIVFAFMQPLNMNFEKYILYALEFYIILPRKRYWLKGTGDPSRLEYVPAKKKEKGKKEVKSEPTKQKNIDDLTNILDNKVK